MTAANASEEDGPDLAVDMDTPETVSMNHSNFQLVQRAIEICSFITAWTPLCEVEEMSYQEIAEQLSIPTETVMCRA